MKNTVFFLMICSLASIIYSCNKPPVYPNAPQIELKEVNYTGGDTIQFILSFKDGDGDLGLSPDDLSYPFEEFVYLKDDNGNYIFYDPTDPTLPEKKCNNYTDHDIYGLPIYKDNTDTIADFVLIEQNPNFYNYFVDIYEKQPDGSFQILDLSDNCIYFTERFFRLSNSEGPINGDLRYRLPGLFNIYGKTVKFRIYIQDRSLNKSNVVETQTYLIK